MVQLLTHSRQDAFKVCRRKHYYSYELGIRTTTDARALRMGSAYHAGIEALGKGHGLEAAFEAVRLHYLSKPEHFDDYEWEIECETVTRLICGYEWYWSNDPLENVETERSFELPLRNPETGKTTPLFNLAGKIDGIVLRGGRLGVKESKLLGDDISIESDLWKRLRIDHQISMYVLAARKLGFAVDHVYYDVSRKPTIAPTPVPLLDGDGLKIVHDAKGERVRNASKVVPVLDENGKKIVIGSAGLRVAGAKGTWKQSADAAIGETLKTEEVPGPFRQTGDTALGYVVQTRPMTVEEWGEKLNEDIAKRPDFYYRRQEIPRLDQDLAEYEAELWNIQKTIREAQKTGAHYRTVNKNTCSFCPFFGICTGGFDIERDALPENLVRVSDLHPELERNLSHDDRNQSPAAASQSAAEATVGAVAVPCTPGER